MRPLLHPALPRFWRGPDTLQIGLEAATGIVISGIHPAVAKLLPAFDGTRDLGQLRRLAESRAAPAEVFDGLVDTFLAAGVLLDADHLARLPSALHPELAPLCLQARSFDAGARTMEQRRSAWVEVRGAGRVGATIATLLAASGVGRLSVVDAGRVAADQVLPGGLSVDDVGRRRGDAVRSAIDRLGLETATVRLTDRSPGVIVLAPLSGLARMEAPVLVRAGIPHLLARAGETTATIGPFVVPGRTSCLRCHDLHRADRDPGWPRVVVQAGSRDAVGAGCAVATAALASAVAVTEVLAFLDGRVPQTWDATLEAVLPSPALRRRSWAPHPACGCLWDDAPGAAETGEFQGHVTMGA